MAIAVVGIALSVGVATNWTWHFWLSAVAVGLIGALLGRSSRWSWLSSWAGVLGLIAIVLAAACSWWSLLGKGTPAPDRAFRDLLLGLAGNVTAGMSYAWASVVSIAAIAYTLWVSTHAARTHDRTDAAWGAAPGGLTAGASWGEVAAWAGIAGALELAFIAFFSGGWHVTVFGWWPDLTAYIALALVIALEFVMLIGGSHAARRALRLAKLVEIGRAAAGTFNPASSYQQPLLWSSIQVTNPPPWPATPVLASLAQAPEYVSDYLKEGQALQYQQAVANALSGRLDSTGLGALYATLADEMTIYRRIIMGMAVCAAAGGIIVFLFPVSEATLLIALDAGILLVGGFTSAFQILQFESNRVLSNVICNRPQKRKWSLRLIAAVLLPFVVLAGIVSIAQVPGVLNAEGGIIQLILEHLPIWK